MRVNWLNLLTIASATVLIGVQVLGLGYATGWAAAGLLHLGEYGEYALEALFSLIGLIGIVAFARTANRNQPIFDRD